MIKVRPLPGDAIVIEADAGERAALATRFGLAGIDRLHAEIDLAATATAIRATGTLSADIQQICAISGEAFPAKIEEGVELRFIEEQDIAVASNDDEEVEIELEADDCDEIEYSGDMFDLGEAIAQTLGLAIDPYAEGPNADEARKRAGITGDDAQSGPLAEALSALSKKG
ncbi:hypothetical protein FIU90_04740 [Erythrobacter sp. THAF29]|nr:hypothetical protein FIU90_04740 [Erythrobacter sp. THAF29]